MLVAFIAMPIVTVNAARIIFVAFSNSNRNWSLLLLLLELYYLWNFRFNTDNHLSFVITAARDNSSLLLKAILHSRLLLLLLSSSRNNHLLSVISCFYMKFIKNILMNIAILAVHFT